MFLSYIHPFNILQTYFFFFLSNKLEITKLEYINHFKFYETFKNLLKNLIPTDPTDFHPYK